MATLIPRILCYLLLGAAFARAEESLPFRVAVPADNLPASAACPDEGAIGFDADVTRAILDLEGHSATLIPVTLPESIELLKAGRIEAITGWPTTSVISAAPDFLISRSYRTSTLSAWVRKDALFRNTADLSHGEVAALMDSPAWTHGKSRGWTMESAPSWETAFTRLREGQLDAVLAPTTTGAEIIRSLELSGLRQLSGEIASLPVAFITTDMATVEFMDSNLSVLQRTGNLGRLEANWSMDQAAPSPFNHDQFLAFGYGALIIMAALLLVHRARPRIRNRSVSGIDTRQIPVSQAPNP